MFGTTKVVPFPEHSPILSSALHPRSILLNLPKNPRIRRGHAADHHRIAAGLGDDGAGVFGRANVAIADHGNLDCLLDGGDPFPARVSAIALLTRPGVQRNRAEAAAFGHARSEERRV